MVEEQIKRRLFNSVYIKEEDLILTKRCMLMNHKRRPKVMWCDWTHRSNQLFIDNCMKWLCLNKRRKTLSEDLISPNFKILFVLCTEGRKAQTIFYRETVELWRKRWLKLHGRCFCLIRFLDKNPLHVQTTLPSIVVIRNIFVQWNAAHCRRQNSIAQ